MATRISVEIADAELDGATALLDGGHIEIRTGAQPGSVATAATGTLLGTLTLASPAFAAASGGSAAVNAVTGDSSADASGTAGWFRAYDSSGVAMIDGNITQTGGGGDMTVADTAIVAGGTINMTSWQINQPLG